MIRGKGMWLKGWGCGARDKDVAGCGVRSRAVGCHGPGVGGGREVAAQGNSVLGYRRTGFRYSGELSYLRHY